MSGTAGGVPGQFGVLGYQARRDWPAVEAEEARRVLSEYGLRAVADPVYWHGQRPFSATALVRLEDGRSVFLKRHDRRLRDERALGAEHGFAAHLAAQNLPVPVPFVTRSGAAAWCLNGWTYEVFPLLNGADRYRDVESWEPYTHSADARAAGAMLARVHQAATGFDAPERAGCALLSSVKLLHGAAWRDTLSAWAGTQAGLTEALAGRDWLSDIIRVFGAFQARFTSLAGTLMPLWGHGDWHGSNLFWSGAAPEVAGIMDFGMADRTSASFDLAVAIERSGVDWLHLGHDDSVRYGQIKAFLAGYCGVRPLLASEQAEVVVFLPLCHIGFALSEVAYYGTMLGDAPSAEVAYESYLLGHGRWFAGAAGTALLTWLPSVLRAGAAG